MNKNTSATKVIVPCRFSYLHCWEPDSVNGGDPKYSVSAIVPKSDTKTVEAIKAAIEQAKKDSASKWGGKIPANLKTPLRDGDIDRPEDEAYKGCYFSMPTAVRLHRWWTEKYSQSLIRAKFTPAVTVVSA